MSEQPQGKLGTYISFFLYSIHLVSWDVQIPSLVFTGVWLKIHMQTVIYLKLCTSIEHHKGKDLLSNSKTIPLMTHRIRKLLKQRKSKQKMEAKNCWQTEHFEVSVFFLQKFFPSGVVRGPNLSLKVDTSRIFHSRKATSFQSDPFPSLTQNTFESKHCLVSPGPWELLSVSSISNLLFAAAWSLCMSYTFPVAYCKCICQL